jgi:hypothetical protein
MPVAGTDIAIWRGEIQQNLLPVGLWRKQVFNRRREVLGQARRVREEPVLLTQPVHPFGGFDLLGKNAAVHSLGEVTAGDPLHAFVRKGNTRGERGASSQQHRGAGFVTGAEQRCEFAYGGEMAQGSGSLGPNR